MNNEPVAWMNPKSLECGYGGEVDWEDTGCIPLYTHPAKTPTLVLDGNRVYPAFKTLTDEEIIEVHINTPFMDGYLNKNLIDFARAILTKAQEK